MPALTSWKAGPAKKAIVEFVEQSRQTVPIEERVAVFDNDGTLWCEKPMPIQLDFILRRLGAIGGADPAPRARPPGEAGPPLRDRQPWKAAYERDYAWLGAVVAQHYAGDETNVRTLAGGILAAYDGMEVEEFEALAETFLRGTRHPTLDRPYLQCAYAPMVELLAYLDAHDFSTYIVSGGGRDFMRPISQEVYGIPRERVIGSTSVRAYAADEPGGRITHTGAMDYLDDGPQKPIRIWSRIGRRPLLAGGNANGDIPMLDFARHADRPHLRLLVCHDDDEREMAYTGGAERALERAADHDWTVVSMRDDWA